MTNGDDSDDGFYDSSVRSQGDFGAVFECDDETGYFYLYDMRGEQPKILSAHHILNGPPDFEQDDISVRWNKTESHVGLLIKNRLWAVCEVETGVCFVGRYRAGNNSNIPEDVVESFKLPN
jgi:hypothetical protein